MARWGAILALLGLVQDTAYYDPSPNWTAVGEPVGDGSSDQEDSFGQALAAAGDVNGDGIDDLLVGAP
ncbi:MAG TPA: integrin alpha, partial [Planctomycetota bacterium]|nr:integrin alpha [Planctomycetota bacterium]